MMTLYASSLLLGTSFHFFFVTVTGIAGGIGGAEHRSRNYALVSLGFSGAGFIGPLIAGFAIDYLGHLTTFRILAAFTVIPVLMLWLSPGFLPGAAKLPGTAGTGGAMELWRAPRLRNTFIASGFISAGWDLFNFYMPVYGHGIGLSASAIGVILGAFALATFVIREALPWLIKHTSEAQILMYAIFAAACAFTLFPFFSNPYALCAGAFEASIEPDYVRRLIRHYGWQVPPERPGVDREAPGQEEDPNGDSPRLPVSAGAATLHGQAPRRAQSSMQRSGRWEPMSLSTVKYFSTAGRHSSFISKTASRHTILESAFS